MHIARSVALKHMWTPVLGFLANVCTKNVGGAWIFLRDIWKEMGGGVLRSRLNRNMFGVLNRPVYSLVSQQTLDKSRRTDIR